MTSPSFLIVTTSFPDEAGAKTMLDALLQQRLVACGHIHQVRSSYWWQDAIVTRPEWILSVKTRAELYETLQSAIQTAHEYDVPMIVATPVVRALPAYADWLGEETSSSVA